MSSINTQSTPTISIGMPIHNGEATLERAIDGILRQSFSNFELLISDNNSNDRTQELCLEYAQRDKRVRYFRQPYNIGPPANFKFVLNIAKGNYFMWAACDDFHSFDFLEKNIEFLDLNSDYVASTSPNCFEGEESSITKFITFSMEGEKFSRFILFFQNCWSSHGIFYAVVRTDILRKCSIVGNSFIAVDWAVDLYLASKGKISRINEGLLVFGKLGHSSKVNPYRAFRNQSIEILFPFYRLTHYVFKLSKGFTLFERLNLVYILLKLNVKAVNDQIISALYQFYCAHFRHLRKSYDKNL